MLFPEGLTARPLTEEDADAVWQVLRSDEAVSPSPIVTTLADVRREFDEPGRDLDADSLGLIDGSGRMVAFVWVSMNPAPTRRRVVRVGGRVAADWHRKGLGSTLIRWASDRARQRLALADADLPVAVEADMYEADVGAVAAYESAGFRVVRYWIEMARDLSRPVAEQSLPTGVAIEPWSADRDDEVRRVHNRAFVDHWGSEPLTGERWRRWLSGHEAFLPDASFVARAGAEIVAYSMSFSYPEEWEELGHSEGWVNGLGTLAEWRGQGLASALLGACLGAFRDAGLDRAALGVDAENPTGALGLYERLGFETIRRELTLHLEDD